MSLPELGRKYIWTDLMALPGDDRYELIDGVPDLLETPPDAHQACLCELERQFGNALLGKTCVCRPSPYIVMPFASPDGDPAMETTVLQPDFSVICDRSRLTRLGCMGPPDLVAEILSPDTIGRDAYDKLHLYETAGVREYWLLDPGGQMLTVYRSENGMFRHRKLYRGAAKVPVTVLDNLEIDIGRAFDVFAVS